MMPFPVMEGETIEVILPYGKQPNPKSGGEFDHKGIDYMAKDKDLYAIASGMVIGMGNDALNGDYVVARYGKYDVTYGNIKDCRVHYGDKVGAGQRIAKVGDYLHLSVSFNGEIIDPEIFLEMIWANIQQLAAMGIKATPVIEDLSEGGKSKYEDSKNDILMLILRWFPSYINEMAQGEYSPNPVTVKEARHTLRLASERNYFYEKMPTVGNPLGLSKRGAPLANKLNDLLISDFLTYLAAKYGIFPPSWDEEQKKNFLRRQQTAVFY